VLQASGLTDSLICFRQSSLFNLRFEVECSHVRTAMSE
jgi:hypothetical protein